MNCTVNSSSNQEERSPPRKMPRTSTTSPIVTGTATSARGARAERNGSLTGVATRRSLALRRHQRPTGARPPAGCATLPRMRIVASEFMSLDGVVQAPGGPEEDTSGGFRHGGWSHPYFDPEVMGPVIGEIADRSEVLLQGRRTYQVSAAAWPERTGDPFADWINGAQKYVVSNTLSDADLTWQPTTIIRGGDLVEKVSALRDQPGGDIYVYG